MKIDIINIVLTDSAFKRNVFITLHKITSTHLTESRLKNGLDFYHNFLLSKGNSQRDQRISNLYVIQKQLTICTVPISKLFENLEQTKNVWSYILAVKKCVVAILKYILLHCFANIFFLFSVTMEL